MFCCINALVIVSDIRQQSDESGTQNGTANGTLIDRRGPCAATRQDATFAVDHLFECFHIFVIDIDGTWNSSIWTEPASQLPLQARSLFADLADVCFRWCRHIFYLEVFSTWDCLQYLEFERSSMAKGCLNCNCWRGSFSLNSP